jgi:hypothetical protein
MLPLPYRDRSAQKRLTAAARIVRAAEDEPLPGRAARLADTGKEGRRDTRTASNIGFDCIGLSHGRERSSIVPLASRSFGKPSSSASHLSTQPKRTGTSRTKSCSARRSLEDTCGNSHRKAEATGRLSRLLAFCPLNTVAPIQFW